MFYGIEISKLILLCAAMFLAGFVDSIAGGGGLISLPAHLVTGIPVTNAIASNKTSACIGTSAATVKFLKNGKLNLKVAIISAIAGIFGSNIGAHILLSLDPSFIKKMIVCVIPFVAIFLFIKKDFGNTNEFESIGHHKVIVISIVFGFLLGLYDGLIGPGTGTFAIMVFSIFLKFDLITSSGNAKLLNLCTGIGSVVYYLISNVIIWPIVICTATADILGNYLGSTLALKKNASFIRIIMIFVVTILLVKLAYDSFF